MDGYPMSMLPKEFADLDRAERTEKARRLSRYDEAIRLLIYRLESCGCALPGPADSESIIEQVCDDTENVNGYCDDCLRAVAFLAAEPADKETT